jgi:hypothetical protein
MPIVAIVASLLAGTAVAQMTPSTNTAVTANEPQCYLSATAGTRTGPCTGARLTSNANLNWQPGNLIAVSATPGGFARVVNASTLDSLIGSATSFTCTTNPTITIYECGTSTTCASGTAMAAVTLTTTGTAVVGTITSAAITAGDYVAFELTAGACTALDFTAAAAVHTN